MKQRFVTSPAVDKSGCCSVKADSSWNTIGCTVIKNKLVQPGWAIASENWNYSSDTMQENWELLDGNHVRDSILYFSILCIKSCRLNALSLVCLVHGHQGFPRPQTGCPGPLTLILPSRRWNFDDVTAWKGATWQSAGLWDTVVNTNVLLQTPFFRISMAHKICLNLVFLLA